MKVNYSVIHSHPEVEHLRDELPRLISEYVQDPDANFAKIHEIVLLSEHFYGLTLENANNDIMDLIDQIEAVEQELRFS
ncbi:MAG: hypothetical protein DDT31_00030 [Syntrophomonadaceae bacterium]|nr:hypothetical protein [Bacillota bacterium]